jgi:hypothetical protein
VLDLLDIKVYQRFSNTQVAFFRVRRLTEKMEINTSKETGNHKPKMIENNKSTK